MCSRTGTASQHHLLLAPPTPTPVATPAMPSTPLPGVKCSSTAPNEKARHTRKILMCGATPVYIVEYRVKTVGGLCQCYWLDTPHKYLPHFPQLHFTKYSKHVDIGSYHIYQMSVFRRRGCQGDYYRYSWGGDGHGREVMDMVGR